jgi:peptidoglycan/xylan/chitin deacetylase (PgdA/CDA1 family)
MMTWDELTQLDKSGFIEFGGHTVHHQIVEPLNDQELSDEIGGSIDEVHRRLTSVSRTFAYPNGTPEDFDERAERVLRQHGVIAAVSTVEGVNTSKSNRFALKRVTIGSQMSLDEFRMRASGLIDKMKRWVYPSSAAT